MPIPGWVKSLLDEWVNAACIAEGCIFKRVNKAGKVSDCAISEKAVWHIVREWAALVGLGKLAPHDLRRTCARLCHTAGRRIGADSVPARARFDSNDGAISRLQTAHPICRQRSHRDRAVIAAVASHEPTPRGD